MTRSSRWSSIAVLAATAAIVFAACGGTTASTAPSATAAAPSATAAASASASAPAFTAINYPETGEAPCGVAPYAGEFKKISAPDARTVVFDLCGSDVAFLSKIAFSSFAINDADWLASHIDPAVTENQKIVSEVNGTGAYKLKAWNRGQDVTYRGVRQVLGHQGPDPDAPSCAGTRKRPSGSSSCRPVPSTASTTSARPTSRPSAATRASRSSRAPASTSSTSASTTRSSRGTTRRSARRSPRASTASASSTPSTRAARKSPTTSPRAPSRTGASVRSGTTSTPPRPRPS